MWNAVCQKYLIVLLDLVAYCSMKASMLFWLFWSIILFTTEDTSHKSQCVTQRQTDPKEDKHFASHWRMTAHSRTVSLYSFLFSFFSFSLFYGCNRYRSKRVKAKGALSLKVVCPNCSKGIKKKYAIWNTPHLSTKFYCSSWTKRWAKHWVGQWKKNQTIQLQSLCWIWVQCGVNIAWMSQRIYISLLLNTQVFPLVAN